MISNTDLICYLFVFINMVASASLLALPIPLMVFLWGTLTVPRPSKTFWVSIIAYTQVVVLIKCIAQFDLWMDKNYNPIADKGPLAPVKIIGIERKPNYATYDLILLLVVFFHRFVQKQMGIWKTGFSDERSAYKGHPADPSIMKPTMMIEHETNNVQQTTINGPDADNQVVATESIGTEAEHSPNYFPTVAKIS